MPTSVLSNIVWHCLTHAHAQHSAGTATAKRYAHGFSPLIAFADPRACDLDAIAPYCEAGETLYGGGWSGPVPAGWQLDVESIVHQMVWRGTARPVESDQAAVRLGPHHVAQAMELVALTHPGPFGERTIELGEYYGVFKDGRLAAMAGERFDAAPLREISGVCTHPDFQGLGLARELVTRLISIQLARGQTPFLHVMHDNDTARGLYERLGFRKANEMPVCIVTRTA
jgi:GNAT superfamily N-acetyltransferase